MASLFFQVVSTHLLNVYGLWPDIGIHLVII